MPPRKQQFDALPGQDIESPSLAGERDQILGVNDIVAEELETAKTGIELFSEVLEEYHVQRNVLRAQIRVLRGEGYRLL